MVRLLKALLVSFTICGILLLVLFLLRVPILRCIGNQLICEDKMEKVEAMFVLGGDPWDRGNEAVRLYKEGYAGKIICTGEIVPRLFLIAGIEYPESELTQMNIIAQGVPESNVELLCKGTSTKEESDYILDYCKEHHISNLAIISSKFHTRRIRHTFRKKFRDAGMQLIIHGAASSAYDEDFWWRSEEGLIFVNNEYIKLCYYWMKGY